MRKHLIRKKRLFKVLDRDIFSDTSVRRDAFLGLVAEKESFIYERHITALTRVLKFHFRRKRGGGSFRINFFLNNFLTKKAVGVRMGKGKGSLSERVFFMRPGFFILSINDMNKERSLYIINKCKRRLPIVCRKIFFGCW